MSNNTNDSAAVAGQEPEAPKAPAPKPERTPKSVHLAIVIKRQCKCGERILEPGTQIGVVSLQPGVTLDYLLDAVRDGFAGRFVSPTEPTAKEAP